MREVQSKNDDSPKAGSQPSGYRIYIKGCLSEEMIAWLDLPVETGTNRDETCLILTSSDQAALYGAILRLRDLGLTLISVDQILI